MKKIFVFAILILTSMPGCELLLSDGDDDIVLRDLTAAEKTSVTSDNTFGFNLLHALQEADPEENLFISPLSVSLALGMTLNGAVGTTYDEMVEVLGRQGLTEKEINEAYRDLTELLENLDPEVVFEIANSIWYREGFQVLPTFLEINQTYFDAEVASLDFSSPDAIDTINNWVDDKTHGKIEEVIKEIGADVVMYLINAIYFKGTWTSEFDEENTYDATFSNADGSESEIKLMSEELPVASYTAPGYRAVDLPYGDSLYSMTVVLPNRGVDVNDVVEKLDDDEWNTMTSQFQKEEIVVQLPRFTLEYEVKLKDVLTTLGIHTAFSDAADFSRIRATGGLKIDNVIHKTFVEVNEEGTEAAAVTVVVIVETSAPQAFTVDRPFVFAIRERHSGSILFVGKVMVL